MAELLAKVSQLQRLDPVLHWFCNRNDIPSGAESRDGSEPEERKPTDIELSTDARRELILETLLLFSYDGTEIVAQKEFLKRNIDRQLGKCEICIMEYYKAKRRLIAKLRDDYEDEEVEIFSNIFNTRDIDRIKNGLQSATLALKNATPKNRGQEALELSALMSLFEAMSCEAFLSDNALVQQCFDEPFKLVQTNVRLQVTHYVPAATVFLFDTDQSRCLWALQGWSRYRKRLTREDFEFAVRDPLTRALALGYSPTTDTNYVQRLWCGLRLIVDKLDNDLITHSLRAMEFDVFRLALDHLQHDTPGLRFLLQTVQKLIHLAPKDFWDAMGAISPTTFIEQIFNNPQYDRFMREARKDENYEFSALKDMISWIQPFMASLQTSHQPAACRALSFQLMERLQADRFPKYAQIECYHVGLGVLTWTLINCNKESFVFDAVGRVVAAETLDVTSDYIGDILSIPNLSTDDEKFTVLADPGLKVIKSALALECKSLRTDQETLQRMEKLPHGFGAYSPTIWDAVIHHLDRGNVLLARAALSGISDLTGLEKFITKGNENHSKEKSEFNVIFGHLIHLVCQMLERINDFKPEDLEKLFSSPETAIALVASLFSPDSNTYEAGINLIKSISGEYARKEAIGHLLLPFFETTLNSFSWSIRRIAKKRTFGSCPRMLKTCTDVLDVLCDSQYGVLRTRSLSGISEVRAMENFWEHQWEALRVIYEMTEEWSRRVGDSSLMKDFCRDTMQFSEHFFDQYSIFTSAVSSANLIKSENSTVQVDVDRAGKELLRHPAQTMESMVKWLRLRDEYLASSSVKLVTRVLERLSERKMTLPEASSNFLEQVVTTQTRTILTPQEKAELARALEANLGRSITTVDIDADQSDTSRSQSSEQAINQGLKASGNSSIKKKAPSGVIDLDTWKAKAKRSGEVLEIPDDDEFDDSDLLDEDILAASRSVDLLKQHQMGRKTVSSSTPEIAALNRISKMKTNNDRRKEIQKQAAQSSFREKREREIQAKKKRDAEVLAKVKRNLPGTIAEKSFEEGSAPSGLGVKGKDHAPKGLGMMVSSGSDTDSDDELDEELFGGAMKTPKVPAAVREYQASKLKQLNAPGPVKKTRQSRSAKDMRARLAPDLSSLHRIILSWDFFCDGHFPPNSDREDYSLVTSTFRTPVEYQNTFEPLLLLEAWQGFLKSREEGNFKVFEIKIVNRLTVDSFIEVSTTMLMADGKELGISEADIVLMSKAESPATDSSQPHCLARVFKITRKKAVMEISYRVNVSNGLLVYMVPNATLHGVKISSITPLERECGALLGLKYYDLCDEIIRAKASPLLKYTDKQIELIVSNYKVNAAQARAVRSALDNDAFTLIQGPPGSGKTKTIVAIVGALLTTTLRDKGVPISRPRLANGISQSNPSASLSKKLLVCAPSNAAVDELVMRFKQGVKTIDGTFHNISIVRLGRSDAINSNVIDVTLEELVNAKLNITSGKKTSTGEDIQKIFLEHKTTSVELHAARANLDEINSKGQAVPPELYRDIEVLKRKKQQLSTKIDVARDSGNTAARDAEISRRRLQQEILDSSHVICATLSGSGHEMFQNLNIEFETVVIDEAAQSIELSALIPLKYGCAKCIMVGDPKQLPPTVLSREAARFQYEQSLFVRMQANQPNDVHLLDTQYRMHPEISAFPSQAFYDGKLLDGAGMAGLRAKPWHESKILGPYRFFNVQGTHQTAPKGHSLINTAELEVALKLFDRLITDCVGYDFTGKVGIITPYKSQLRELRSRFARKYGDTIFNTIEFNTTDAFQGRESEIIIFSCVRASVSRGIGFLSDIRRMNVGITRAKSSLWVLGNSQSLMQGEFWDNLIKDARNRDRYTEGNILELLQKPLVKMKPISQNMALEANRAAAVIPTTQEVEMKDAPFPVKANPRAFPLAQHNDIDHDKMNATLNDKTRRRSSNDSSATNSDTYHPSGGNGLNAKAFCDICGSYKHATRYCDNQEAKTFALGSCYRCGSVSHLAKLCTAERCFDCGKFGHSARVCTSSTPLSKREKDTIHKEESRHKALVQKSPEVMRKKQIGDHDKSVPAVKTTRRTPPPAEIDRNSSNNNLPAAQKRKRGTSPPFDTVKGPQLAVNRHASFKEGNIGARRDIPPKAQEYTSTSSSNSTTHHDSASSNISRTNVQYLHSPTASTPQTINGHTPQLEYHLNNGAEAPQPHKPNQLDMIPKDLSISGDVKKPPPANRNLLPRPIAQPHPARKKKDVNPFIIPKPRKPRP